MTNPLPTTKAESEGAKGEIEERAPCQERELLWSEGPDGEITLHRRCFSCGEMFGTEFAFKEHARIAMLDFAEEQAARQEVFENSLRGSGEL